MGCFPNGKTPCGAVCATITPRQSVPEKQPMEKPADKPAEKTAGRFPVNPFELESNILPQESADDEQVFPIQELPIQQEKAGEFPYPPEPITKTTGNPFIRVSQTREVRSQVKVAAAQAPESHILSDWQSQPEGSQDFSEAWADALGLPSNDSQSVAPYHRDR
jgi:hypothetical protein